MNDSSASHPITKLLKGCNLYLIGMMGSGKSSTARPLAKQLGYSFVDSDAVIEEVTKKSIDKIFIEEGEEGFRDIESQVIRAIGERHSLVVATGGGVVIRPENWGTLHQGIVIWLNPPLQTLTDRLQSDPLKRPLLDNSEWTSELECLLKKRQSLYSEADLQLVVENENANEVAQKILELLPSKLTALEAQAGPQTTAIQNQV